MTEAAGRRYRRALALTLALLIASNVIANLAIPSIWYVPWNAAVAVALIAVALRVGDLDLAHLGLGSDDAAAGLRLGGAVGGGILALILLAAVLPVTRTLFVDDVGRIDGAELIVKLLVTLPLGTVLMEEIAFRGCLPALLDSLPGWTTRRSTLTSAGLFGLWHVLPSLDLGSRNETLGSVSDGILGRWVPVAAAVVATAVAGWALMWLRRRSSSVAAPVLVHYSLNAAGIVAAWIATR